MAGKKRAQSAPTQVALADRIRRMHGKAGEALALDRLESELPGSQRYDLVAALKELEKAGYGELRMGRKGERPRFVWAAAASSAGATAAAEVASPARSMATGRASRVQAAPAATIAARGAKLNTGLLEHSFHVRPHVMATFRLPEDITPQEIDRLCQLLQAIPFR
jgi:hypothetical protein